MLVNRLLFFVLYCLILIFLFVEYYKESLFEIWIQFLFLCLRVFKLIWPLLLCGRRRRRLFRFIIYTHYYSSRHMRGMRDVMRNCLVIRKFYSLLFGFHNYGPTFTHHPCYYYYLVFREEREGRAGEGRKKSWRDVEKTMKDF